MTTEAVEEIARSVGTGAGPLLEQSECRHAEAVATAIYEDAERSKRAEVEEALGKLDPGGERNDAQRDVIEGMADAIVERLLAAPLSSIRRGGDEPALDTVVRLFDIEVVEADDDGMDGRRSHREEVTGVDS
ncbi:hypothetical protein [Haloarchaeobius iranensis]|uniref:Glutamyl-tRNA reductase n=1 Tax=Haloarchaeobius iranensis TaxID=996166 RepID=A0A1G9ZNB5_9EURY|nr:hypothetical protein [Haloarchaeobius iranensis]SDN22859.1 glutamyl-tRNA reductase [Haloarchaeobius iranensis]